MDKKYYKVKNVTTGETLKNYILPESVNIYPSYSFHGETFLEDIEENNIACFELDTNASINIILNIKNIDKLPNVLKYKVQQIIIKAKLK
jgi:hypothetical protein